MANMPANAMAHTGPYETCAGTDGDYDTVQNADDDCDATTDSVSARLNFDRQILLLSNPGFRGA